MEFGVPKPASIGLGCCGALSKNRYEHVHVACLRPSLASNIFGKGPTAALFVLKRYIGFKNSSGCNLQSGL